MYDGFDEYKAQRMCKNLLKVNYGSETITISLDVERSGLNLECETICYVMKKFYNRIRFYYDVVDERKFRKIEFNGFEIILTKH